MVVMNLLKSIRIVVIVFILVFSCLTCKHDAHDKTTEKSEQQKNVLWVWNRPSDLRFLDKNDFEFALLTKTLEFDESHVKVISRQSSVLVAEHAMVFPVIRLERIGISTRFSANVTNELIDRICADVKNYPGAMKIQIDFDARMSEREWYKNLIKTIRNCLPIDWSLSITTIASWCYDKDWLESLSADEIVPMFFRMGRDSSHMRQEFHNFFSSFNDDRKYCPGISLDEPLQIASRTQKLYVFNPKPWDKESIALLRSYLAYEKKD